MSRDSFNRFVAAARAVAGLLLVAFLLLESLSANSGFHYALHHDRNATSGSCALCQFAHGHVDLPQSVPLTTVRICRPFVLVPRMESITLVDFRYRMSPSRAPPSRSSLLSVLA